MLALFVDRAASAFSVPAEAALNTFASLLLVYCCTSVPVLLWALKQYVTSRKSSSSSAQTAVVETANKDLPSPEAVQRLIKARRSRFPKDYTGETFDRSIVEQLLEAANWAPTHGRTEPWKFVVLGRAKQEELLDLTLKVLERECEPEVLPKKRAKVQNKRLKDYPKVPYMVAICMRRQALPEKVMPEWEEMCAVASAVQNLWLAAEAHGIAGYWSSWTVEARDSQDMRDFLGLGPEDKCLGVFMLGRCANMSISRSTRRQLSEKVEWRL